MTAEDPDPRDRTPGVPRAAMRIASLALVSALMAGLAMAEPPVAHAVSPAEEAEVVAGLVHAAITASEPGALRALMGPSVRYDLRGLSPCSGIGRKGTARGGKRAKLAQCVMFRLYGFAGGFASRVAPQGPSSDRFQVEMPLGRDQLVIELRPHRGDLVVVALAYRAGERPAPPVEVLRSWTQPAGTISAPALEQLRLSGDPALSPDASTAAAIVASGEFLVLASLRVCLDDAGAISNVALLSSSGFPAYDATLKAGIRTWRFRPHLVDGTATPICARVQFEYFPRSAPTP